MTLLQVPAAFPEIVTSPAADSLAAHLRIHAPNEVARRRLDADRSPILMAFSRHRRVPLPWDALMPADRRSGASEIASLRAAIERSWGVTAEAVDASAKMPRFVIVASDAARFVALWVSDGLKSRREAVPNGAVILREPAEDGARYYWARPKAGATLDFIGSYDAAWTNTDTLVRVFESSLLPLPDLDFDLSGDALLADGTKRFLDVPIRDHGFVFRPPGFPGRLIRLPDLGAPRQKGSYSRQPETLRSELEEAWGLIRIPAATLQKHVFRASQVGALVRLDAATMRSKTPADGSPLAQLTAERSATKPIDGQTWVLESHGRYHRVILRGGLDAATVDLRDASTYQQAWKGDVEGLELVGLPDALPFSHYQSIDLRPQAILEQLTQLNVERDLAGSFDKIGDTLLASLAGMSSSSIEDIDLIAERCRQLKSRAPVVESARQTLRERAQRLGYHLALVDERIPLVEPGATKVLSAGHLYQRFQNHGSYSYSVTTPKTTLLLFGISITTYETHTYTVYRQFLDAIEIVPEREPWVAAMDALSQNGFTCYKFALTESGYVSEEGVPLVDVMRRAEVDEPFRRTLAVFIPVYQQRLTTGMVLVKYEVIVRPLPGFAPAVFPALHLEENLSYRAEWRGTELGELLHSVTLAPGEERNISINRSVKQTTERVDSIVSVLDVTQTQKLDLSEAIENTSRRENSTTSNSNWNVKAGGSYGPFSAEGGGGGSTTQTSKEFAENVRKQAMLASRELRVNQRQEVRSSQTSTTSIAADEATSSRITNINQGRTLNLLFHELDNVFEGGVFLDDVKLVYTPSVPLIAGTRLMDPLTVSMRDLKRVVEAIASDQLFFSTFAADREAVQRAAARQVLQTVLSEYVQEPAAAGPQLAAAAKVGSLEGERAAAADSMAVPALRFSQPLEPAQDAWLYGSSMKTSELSLDAAGEQEVREASVSDEIEAVVDVLRRLTTTNEPLVPHTLVTPASATYLDVALGAVAATEPYSEEMRARELAIRAAEALDKAAEGELKRARAIALVHGSGASAEPRFALKEPAVVSAQLDDRKLKVTLSAPLPPGSWEAIVNDRARIPLPPAQSASFNIAIDKGVLPEGAGLQSLVLIDRLLGIYVQHPA